MYTSKKNLQVVLDLAEIACNEHWYPATKVYIQELKEALKELKNWKIEIKDAE